MMANQVVDNRHGEAKRVLTFKSHHGINHEAKRPLYSLFDQQTHKDFRHRASLYVTSAHLFVSIILCPVLYILVFILCIHTCIVHSMCQDLHFITFIVFIYFSHHHDILSRLYDKEIYLEMNQVQHLMVQICLF